MLSQLLLGAIGGFLYEISKEDNNEKIRDFSAPPKAEPIQDLTDEQIKNILLNPKVKATIDEIIKHQSGVINVFDPEGYYRDKDIGITNVFKNEEEAIQAMQRLNEKCAKETKKYNHKPYILKIEDD